MSELPNYLHKVSWEYWTWKLVTADEHSLTFNPSLLRYFNDCYFFFPASDCEINIGFPSSKPTHFQTNFFLSIFVYFFLVFPSLIALFVLYSPLVLTWWWLIDSNDVASQPSFWQVQYVQHFHLFPVQWALDSPICLEMHLCTYSRLKGYLTGIM